MMIYKKTKRKKEEKKIYNKKSDISESEKKIQIR